MTEKPFEEFENDFSDINNENLLSKIWTHPSDTLKYILKNCPDKYVTILFALGGISRSISRASEKGMGDNMPTIAVLGLSAILGGLFGWISYYIYAWALSWTGSWLGGKSDSTKFKTVIAWSLIPTICSILLLIPGLIILGDDLFKSQPLIDSMFINICWVVYGIIELGLGIWTMIILVIGISIVQKFGIGKSILNMILPVLLLLIPILLIFIVFSI